MAVELMIAINIPRNLRQYGIEHLQAVQEYYDQVIKLYHAASITLYIIGALFTKHKQFI